MSDAELLLEAQLNINKAVDCIDQMAKHDDLIVNIADLLEETVKLVKTYTKLRTEVHG